MDQLIINIAIDSTKCNRKGLTDIRSGQTSTTNGQANEQISNTSGQTGTLSGNGILRVSKRVLRVLRLVK